MTDILRYAAFTTDPAGGNPAGVALEASGLSADQMQALAAEVGFSETAFVLGSENGGGRPRMRVRYFSPATEVDFCGHATIATGVAWAERHGPGDLQLDTNAGDIELSVSDGGDGLRATLTSVPTSVSEVPAPVLEEALAALRWPADDLDPSLRPVVAFGGVRHLVLATRTRQRLAELDYDFERLRALMQAEDWTTLQLVHRESRTRFHSRNPFAIGGVVEDPATGAAAAAFGGYLRDLGQLRPGEELLIIQGEDMGRKSLLHVELAGDGRVRVSGHARRMT